MADYSTNVDLAVDGGEPVRTTPFPTRSVVTLADRAAALRVFDEAIAENRAIGYGGPEESAYCREFAEQLGGGYADGVNSGTSAVYIALRALELEAFGEVVVAAINDAGALMAIALANLVPVIADAAPGMVNSGADEIASRFSARTVGVLLPHFGGEPAEIAEVAALAQEAGVPLVEDCAQAHGASIDGRPVGTWGDLAVFSTMFMKHHSTGGQGGIVYTRREGLHTSARRFADRGKPIGLPPGSTNAVASLNFNMDELHAAIGRSQLKRLPDAVRERRRLAERVLGSVEAATGGVLTAPERVAGAEPSFWFLRLVFHGDLVRCTKARFVEAVAAEGIPVLGDPALPHSFVWFRERRVFGKSGLPWTASDYDGERAPEYPCPNAVATIASNVSLAINERWVEQDVEDALAALAKVSSAFRTGRPATVS